MQTNTIKLSLLKIWRRFLNQSISKKLIIVYLIASLTPVLFLGLLAYHLTADRITELYISKTSQTADNNIEKLSSILRENVAPTVGLSGSIGIAKATLSNNTEGLNSFLNTLIRSISASKTDINVRLYVYTDDHIIFTNDNEMVYPEFPLSESQKREFDESREYFIFGQPIQKNGKWYTSYLIKAGGQKLVLNDTEYRIDYIMAKFNNSLFQPIGLSADENQALYIVDPNGIVFSSSNGEAVGEKIGNFIPQYSIPDGYYSDGENNNIVFLRTNKLYGWKLYLTLPKSIIDAEVSQIKTTVFIIVLLCAVIAIALVRILENAITKPIISLSKALRANNGSKPAASFDYKYAYQDEVGLLVDSFRAKTKQINEYIEEQQRANKRIADAQFLAYTAQLNPHFMYNTMSTIIWLIEDGRMHDATYAINMLSTLLRNTMTKTGRIVPIGEELEHVKSYIAIQQLRYNEEFKCMLYFEDEILNYRITRVVLQPIVENAIYHGIKSLEEGGVIKILGKKEDGKIIISVHDNGSCDEKHIENINNMLRDETNTGSGLGVKNVHFRLRNEFGEDYGLHFEKQGEFTVAVIEIPAQKWKD